MSTAPRRGVGGILAVRHFAGGVRRFSRQALLVGVANYVSRMVYDATHGDS
eukprot:COSAG01_NODE_25696_length_736_cov_4.538462_1_plen_50_part_10